MTEPPGKAGAQTSGRPTSPGGQYALNSGRRSRAATVALCGATALFGAACVLLSDYALAPFSKPEFCACCHEMDAQRTSWQESTHYTNRSGVTVSCVECHLPAQDDRLAHLAAKCRAGIQHAAVHFLGRYDPAAARQGVQRTMPNERCVNCHSRLNGSPSSPAVGIVHETALRRTLDRAHACVTCHDAVHGPRTATATAKTHKRGDNSFCLVCHVNFQREPFTVSHLIADVACVKCHGPSRPHAADEEHLTAPDILFSKAGLNASCLTLDCHPRAEMETEIGHRPFFAGADADHPYCTDCHGKHWLPTGRSVGTRCRDN